MGLFTADYVLDGACARLAEGDEIHLCVGEPTDYADAVGSLDGAAGKSVGSVTVTPGDGGGDYTLSDGDTSGRKVTVTGQSITLDTGSDSPTADNCDHLAIVDTGNSRLLHVAPTETKALSNGDTYNSNAFDAMENQDVA